VQWNIRLVDIDDGQGLHFHDGRVERDWDLVVGADGAWSKVRRHLTDEVPVFAGMSGQTFKIPQASTLNVPLLRAITSGSGTIFAFSDGKAFIIHLLRQDCASLTLFQLVNGPPECQPAEQPTAIAVLDDLRDQYADWSPRLLQLFDSVQLDSARTWPLYALPDNFRWKHKQGITLLGDAAHLMTPFGGNGVNLALFDAWKLSEAIISATRTPLSKQHAALDEAVRAFERDMLETAHAARKVSTKLIELSMMEEDAPKVGIEKVIMLRAKSELKPRMKSWPLLRPVLACGVYGFYALLKAVR